MSTPESATTHLPPRRNPLSKLAALLTGVFGLICLSCCVGSWFFARSSKNEVATEAGRITEIASEISHIDVPARFRPKRGQAIDTMFEQVSAAVWESEDGGIILLGRTSQPFDATTSDFEQALARIPIGEMLHRSPYYGGGGGGITVEVEIHGEKIEFDVSDMSVWGIPGVSETFGVFPTADGKTGVIYIRTKGQTESTDEEVKNVLHSIR